MAETTKESKKKFSKGIITVQANDFIQKASYKNFDTVDIKIFKTILGKINHNDTLFKDFYTIDYDDLDEVNIDKKNRFAIVTKSLTPKNNNLIFILEKFYQKREQQKLLFGNFTKPILKINRVITIYFDYAKK